MAIGLFQDFIFGAFASVGFAVMANVPAKALPYCGFIAGIGHAVCYVLMHKGIGIICGSFAAALAVGMLAVLLSRRSRCPAESLSFPSLLPMIPGMYAYRAVHAMVGCLSSEAESQFDHNLYLLHYNSMVTFFVIFLMVVGVTLPLFAMKKMSFEATRNKRHGIKTD